MRARVLLLALLLTAVAGPLLLRSASGAPGAIEPGEQVVLEHVAAGELVAARAAILKLRPGALDSARARRVDLLELAVALSEADQSGEAPAREAVRARLDRMSERVDPRDLQLLRALTRALGAPGQVYFTSLLRAARAQVGPRQPRSVLLELTRDPDPELRRLAVSALAGQLAPIRARVNAGDELGPAEQRALSNPELIRALIERLGDRVSGPGESAGVTDDIPADLAAAAPGVASALHALVLVEAPALPALRQEATRSTGARQAIAAIESAIAVRLGRYPRSTWCSAQGAPPREAVAARRPCPACQTPLPASARYCPACGARARQGCPACHQLLDPGATFCPGCGASATPPPAPGAGARTCPACRAELRTPGRYCPECGAEVRADRDE